MAETALHTPPPSAAGLRPSERERAYRRNYPLMLADFVLFTVALNIIGSSTVIPDFVRKLTDVEVLIGLSGQMFEVGWLLPQLLVARVLVRVERKKWWFVVPNIPVRLMMLAFAAVIVLLGGEHKTLLLGLFFVFYGLAALGDGVVGVPWIDLAGSSLDDRRRARMMGLGTALVGVLVLALAPLIGYILGDNGPGFPNNYALLFFMAGAVFVCTIPLGIFVRELPGGKPRQVPALRDYLPELVNVLRQDGPYRMMVLARVLLALFTLANPFYIGFATERLDIANEIAVRNSLIMHTLGTVIGSLLFSWLGDRRSLQFIRLGLLAAIAQPALALLAEPVGPALLYLAFGMGGVVIGALGISFLNWVIMYATPEDRPIYSGLFNSMTAVGLLVAPLIGGLLVEVVGYAAAFGAALVLVIGATVIVFRGGVDPQMARAQRAGGAAA